MENEIKNLQAIFDKGLYAPYFKDNPRYPLGLGVAFIAYDDVMAMKYIIRTFEVDGDNRPSSYRSETTDPVVAQYNSIEELVADGWRLD